MGTFAYREARKKDTIELFPFKFGPTLMGTIDGYETSETDTKLVEESVSIQIWPHVNGNPAERAMDSK